MTYRAKRVEQQRKEIVHLSSIIEKYADPADKLTIALGNFNRVIAERDRLADQLAAAAEAWFQFDQQRLDELLPQSLLPDEEEARSGV